jgi:ribose transport system ATP-binding protein
MLVARDGLGVEMRGIVKDFPGVRALDNVDFTAHSGEIMGLVGENGAGKSTLIKILSGVYQKDAGQIFIEGREVNLNTPAKALSLGICIIYQEPDIVPALTVKENIFIGHMPTRTGLLRMSQMAGEAQRLVKELGFDIDVNTEASNLYLAQQQIVTIARALSRNVRILVLDEPAATISERDLCALFILLRNLANRGITVIYISHRLQEVLNITDRITVLKDGRMVGVVQTTEATEDSLTRMMVGRTLQEYYPSHQVKLSEDVFRIEDLTTEDVHNISFTLHKGEILGIYGLVGSGRTELAKALFGIIPHKLGHIFVEQKEARITGPRDAIGLGICFLTEDRKGEGLVLNASVSTNITMASYKAIARMGWINRLREQDIAQRYVDLLKIKISSLRNPVEILSGGNQQKVVISKWLCIEPKILIFDEPTRGIDVGAKMEIYQLIADLLKQGVGIILISSELNEILGMCDRIMVMHEGTIVDEVDKSLATEELLCSIAIGGRSNDNAG